MRFRITAIAVAVFAVVAVSGGVGLILLQEEAFDESLEEAARDSAEVFDDADEATAALKRSLSVGVPVVVALFGVTVWVLVGGTLRPVESIRAEVEALGDGRWDGRIPEPGTGDEIDRLARTMNAMLARLRESGERQRRFVGDASHELRSPLTRLRTQIEVVRADPDADRDAALDDALTELVELSDLVEDLLVLARLDEGGALERDEVDLDVVVTRVASPYRQLRPGVVVDGSRIGAARTIGDDRLLRRAIENLVRNGVRHARTRVELATRERADAVEIVVTDDGPGIPEPQRERVFERFTRLDDARTRDAGGVGLGLAISREVVERHGGTITIADAEAGGARFTVRLPLPNARPEPLDQQAPWSRDSGRP